MNKKHVKRAGLLAVSLLVCSSIVVETQNSHRLKESNEQLTEALDIEKEEREEEQWLYNLAVEFQTNPLIVDLVDHFAKEHMRREEEKEWRLIQNHRSLTYLFLSLIQVESNHEPNAVGDNGKARGLTQIWVTTAQQYEPEVTDMELLNPTTNIRVGLIHYHELLKRYKGNPWLANLAWNRGERRVDDLISYGQSPANGYGERVFTAALSFNREMLAQWRNR
jgi:soluble lytic murein transglycosylase-like protein